MEGQSIEELAELNYFGGCRGRTHHVDPEVNIERKDDLLADPVWISFTHMMSIFLLKLTNEATFTLLFLVIRTTKDVN